MKRLPYEDYQRLIDGGRTLAHDTHGAKVIETNDGRMVKLFRTKRLLSAAQWNPYAKRFARNALRLSSLGFPTIEVVAVCRVREIRRDIAVYRRLEGETLRDVLHDAPAEANDLFPRLADLLARLHRHGILFRSIHFGNVLVMRDGVLGLIDVADMRKRPLGALTLGQRSRNFRHMLRYAEDRDALAAYGVERFLADYKLASGLNEVEAAHLGAKLTELAANPRP